MPVLNEAVVDLAIAVALALNASICDRAGFARKNYFYPDLPKGYQITQDAEPLARDGHLDVKFEGHTRRVGIRQIHIEEDAGKSVHAEHGGGGSSLIDMNRCGVPLVEIVTRPDLRNVDEADEFLNELRRILVCLGVTTGEMHEGGIRFDTNISVRPKGTKELGTQTEIKNLNSFRAVRKALVYEADRQSRVLRDGGKVVHETLLWDESRERAVPMRSKEGASDYRYFPEPDLVDFEIDERRLERVRESMPELPDASRRRLVEVYAIPEYAAFVLTAETSTLRLYESTVGALLGRLGPDAPPTAAKTVSNWVMVVLAGHLNEHGITLAELSVRVGSHDPIGRQDGASVLPSRLADVIALRLRGEVSEPAARRLFEAAMESAEPIEKLVEKLDLRAVSDEDTVRSLVREVLAAHPDEVARYRSGATKLMRFFIGQVLGRTGGKADPELATRVLLEELGNGGTT